MPRIRQVKRGKLTQLAIENFCNDLLKSLCRLLARKEATSGLCLKVSDKAGVLVYGMGRFPVS